MSLGDFDAGTVVYSKFTTYRPSTGAPFVLAGSPALSVYKDNSTTQSTAGITLTADFDSVAGFNHFAIDTSADGTFYAAGSFFDVVITTGTVDSVSAVGTVVGRFTLGKTSALKPTTAGRTLDVSAGGEAGVDWANVGSPTTVVGLSGTTVKTATDVETDTADIQTRLPAALVSGRIDSSVGAMAANVMTAAAAAADLTTELQSGLSTLDAAGIRTAVGLASANLDTQIGTLATAANLATVAGYIDTEIATIITALGVIDDFLDTEIAAIKAKTDLIPATPAATGDAMALTSAERNAVADALLARNVSGGSSAGRTVKQALHILRNKTSIAAGTLTVTDVDDTTASWTAAVTTTAGNPISAIDPA